MYKVRLCNVKSGYHRNGKKLDSTLFVEVFSNFCLETFFSYPLFCIITVYVQFLLLINQGFWLIIKKTIYNAYV